MGQIFWNEYYRLLDSGENVDVLTIGDSRLHPKSAAFARLVAECWSGPARAALGLS